MEKENTISKSLGSVSEWRGQRQDVYEVFLGYGLRWTLQCRSEGDEGESHGFWGEGEGLIRIGEVGT